MDTAAASKYHRFLVLAFVCSVTIWVARAVGIPGARLLVIPLFCAYGYGSYKLATALGKKGVLWGLLGLLPVVGFIAVLLLLNASHKAFRVAGFRVHFLGGATPSAIEAKRLDARQPATVK